MWSPTYGALLSALGSHEELRDPLTQPAGMVNLSATCYLNAQMQVMFSCLPLRAAVLAWRPPDSPLVSSGAGAATAESDARDMTQLQTLFSHLLSTHRRAVNPRMFVKSFDLDAGYQQDATEFHKLLLSMLEGFFQRSTHLPKSLRDIVPNLYRGDRAHVTTCRGCNRASEKLEPFYELELPIRGRASVEAALRASLEPESLDGDNAYECDECTVRQKKGKQTAQRSTAIRSLPPLLHVQLLRFIYDPSIGGKRKLRDTVAIPDIFDVREAAGEAGKSLDPTKSLYELTGVLYHRGDSAHAGHYVADVWDSERLVWWRCDDTVISPLEPIDQQSAAAKVAATPVSATPDALAAANAPLSADPPPNKNSKKSTKGLTTVTIDDAEKMTKGAPSSGEDKLQTKLTFGGVVPSKRTRVALRDKISAQEQEQVDIALAVSMSEAAAAAPRRASVSTANDIYEVETTAAVLKGPPLLAGSPPLSSSSAPPQVSCLRFDLTAATAALAASPQPPFNVNVPAVAGAVPPLQPRASVIDLSAAPSVDASVDSRRVPEAATVSIPRETWYARRSHPLFRGSAPSMRDAYLLIYQQVDEARVADFQKARSVPQRAAAAPPAPKAAAASRKRKQVIESSQENETPVEISSSASQPAFAPAVEAHGTQRISVLPPPPAEPYAAVAKLFGDLAAATTAFRGPRGGGGRGQITRRVPGQVRRPRRCRDSSRLLRC